MFPKIFFDEYQICFIKEWILTHGAFKKVLISNANVQSGQAVNFDFIPAIQELATRHPKTMFILTNKESSINLKLNNIIYSSDIIKTSNMDLNENAYLGTFCDIIVGRASGPFTFCFNQDILFNRDVKMISFSFETKDYAHYLKADWLGEKLRDKIKYKADIIHSSKRSGKEACNVIEGLLNE